MGTAPKHFGQLLCCAPRLPQHCKSHTAFAKNRTTMLRVMLCTVLCSSSFPHPRSQQETVLGATRSRRRQSATCGRKRCPVGFFLRRNLNVHRNDPQRFGAAPMFLEKTRGRPSGSPPHSAAAAIENRLDSFVDYPAENQPSSGRSQMRGGRPVV
jgi:hypothetical protein